MPTDFRFQAIYLQRFGQNYQKALAGFNPEEQIDIASHLLNLVECLRQQEPDTKKIADIHENLLKKYRKRLTEFYNLGIMDYFSPQSSKQLDLQMEMELPGAGRENTYFTPEQFQQFLTGVVHLLQNEKHFIYLGTEPTETATPETLPLKTRGRVKRERDDGFTRLSQEQTALFIYLLRQSRIILQKDYLSNKEAGLGFGLLTGYSSDTLRQDLSHFELKRLVSPKNTEAILNGLSELQRQLLACKDKLK